jgi:hypothetical protein
MDEDIRNQITREDILDAVAALDRGEPHSFGPLTFYDLLEGGRRYPPKGRCWSGRPSGARPPTSTG